AELDHHEQAQDGCDQREGEQAPRVAQRRAASDPPARGRHGALPAGALASGVGAGSVGLATARDSRSVTEPANAGTSTVSGSAHEIPIPNDPRRVRTNSSQPGRDESVVNSSFGPIADTSYGPVRYAWFTSTEPPMSMIEVLVVIRSSLIAMASAPD